MTYGVKDKLAAISGFFYSASDGFVVTDNDSNIIVSNRAMEVLTGYPVEHLEKMNIRELIPAGVTSVHDAPLSRLIEDEGSRHITPLSAVPLQRRGGKVVRVDVERRVIQYEDGTTVYAGIVRLAQDQSVA